MSCHHEASGSDHGHNHCDHDHVPAPTTNASQSLYEYIDTPHIRALNQDPECDATKVFKPWNERLIATPKTILNSDIDIDEQLILYVPFTGQVSVHSILLRSTADQAAPDHVKVFKNREDVDFELAEDLTPTFAFRHPINIGGTISEESEEVGTSESSSSQASLQNEGIVEYALPRAAFTNINSLSLFFEDNHGSEVTTLLFVGFRGEFKGVRNQGIPISLVYESAANPSDHKVAQAPNWNSAKMQ
ncbi:DUF1000-domain-containing protein [Nadsonia fulvescens var. elongata DSM 6958]|uniref:DUF1000-domain-containing protein n=1 Tax=Nadsonia fulvescens var. elongata DSM 6958 TaxID=857566 RepID=A0A1E3PF19_9ASCO|nr:DUF1000-domain-containing protein [Nadsonia fulvescens var. elongata DSM 6958]